jgi:hypothetical protein
LLGIEGRRDRVIDCCMEQGEGAPRANRVAPTPLDKIECNRRPRQNAGAIAPPADRGVGHSAAQRLHAQQLIQLGAGRRRGRRRAQLIGGRQ